MIKPEKINFSLENVQSEALMYLARNIYVLLKLDSGTTSDNIEITPDLESKEWASGFACAIGTIMGAKGIPAIFHSDKEVKRVAKVLTKLYGAHSIEELLSKHKNKFEREQ